MVPIQYKYTSSYTGDLIIRTPKLWVYERKDKVNQALNGYSLGLNIPSSDADNQFYNFLLEVTEIIKK